MSMVRSTFCTLVARRHGGVSAPVKYGLKGTIPGLTNSRVGSSEGSGALGTRSCPVAVKWRRKRCRMSSVFIAVSSSVVRPRSLREVLGRGAEPAVQPGALAQLVFPVAHRVADVVGEVTHRLRQVAYRGCDTGGGERLS